MKIFIPTKSWLKARVSRNFSISEDSTKWCPDSTLLLAPDPTGHGQLADYPNDTRLPFQKFCLKIGSGQSSIFILIRIRFPHFSNWVDQRWCLSGILFQVVLISRVDKYKSTLQWILRPLVSTQSLILSKLQDCIRHAIHCQRRIFCDSCCYIGKRLYHSSSGSTGVYANFHQRDSGRSGSWFHHIWPLRYDCRHVFWHLHLCLRSLVYCSLECTNFCDTVIGCSFANSTQIPPFRIFELTVLKRLSW